MTPVLVCAALLLGLTTGSVLNIVIRRVPRGESVVSPPSSCPRCDQPVRYWDNLPVLGWLLLRARCRDCGSRLSVRYPLVEVGTAAAFVLVTLWVGPAWHLSAFWYLVSISIALALIDIDVHRLPNAIVLPSYPVAAILLAVPSVLAADWSQLLRAAGGCLALYGLYFLLWLAYPAGMGFGDVKLAGVLGMYLGWLGWAELAVGAFAAFLVGGLFGITLMLSSRAGRKTRIPFGPFMLTGAWIGAVWGSNLAGWYLDLMGL